MVAAVDEISVNDRGVALICIATGRNFVQRLLPVECAIYNHCCWACDKTAQIESIAGDRNYSDCIYRKDWNLS